MDTFDHVKKSIVDAAKDAGDTIVDAAKSTRDAMVDAKDAVVDAAIDVKDKTVDVAHDAKDMVVKLVDTVTNAVTGDSPRDILSMLKADHEVVAGYFDQLEATSGAARTLREGLFSQLKYELEAHSVAEEKHFYSALRKGHESPALLSEAQADHDLVKQLLDDLSAQSVSGESWLPLLRVLKENVLRHVQMEEDELFDCAKQCMSESQREAVGQRFQAEKKRLDGSDRGARGHQAARRTPPKPALKKTTRQAVSAHR